MNRDDTPRFIHRRSGTGNANRFDPSPSFKLKQTAEQASRTFRVSRLT
jgi:hypothetical protein